MLIRISTEKSLDETAIALHAAIQANQFGVLHVHNLSEVMNKKGVEFPRECMIFEVCNAQEAKRVLDQDMGVSTVLPCRISIYKEGGKTVLATLKPTTVLRLFDLPQLDGTAKEIEDKLVRIMTEATETRG